MTHSVSNLHEAQTVIVGVDTHTHMHVAVAIDSRGIRLGAHSFGADSEGYRALLTWAEAYGGIEAVGIEGTGGYGVGLSRTVHRAGHRVVEVNRVGLNRPGFPRGSISWEDGVHGKTEEVLTGGSRAGGPVGVRPRTSARLAVGGDPVSGGEDRVHVGDAPPLGPAGRA